MRRYSLGLAVAMIILGAELNLSYAAQPDPSRLVESTEPQVRVVGEVVYFKADIPPTANLHRAGGTPGAGSLPLEFDPRLFGTTFIGFAVIGDITRYCLSGSFDLGFYTAHGDGSVPSSVPASGFVGALIGDSSYPVAGVFLSDTPTQPGPTGRFALADPGGQVFPALGQPFFIGGGAPEAIMSGSR